MKGKQQNHFKKCNKTKKKKEKSFMIVRFVYLNGLPIVALTLKVSDKNNWCLSQNGEN